MVTVKRVNDCISGRRTSCASKIGRSGGEGCMEETFPLRGTNVLKYQYCSNSLTDEARVTHLMPPASLFFTNQPLELPVSIFNYQLSGLSGRAHAFDLLYDLSIFFRFQPCTDSCNFQRGLV
jgi:hypothetical protein